MKNGDFVVAGYLLALVIQWLSILPAPVLLALSARALAGLVAPWIVWTFWITAGMKVVTSIPAVVMQPFVREVMGIQMPVQLFRTMIGVSSVVNWWLGLLFFVALLALCRKIRKESRTAGLAVPPDAGVSGAP